jgi:hypothetical protein
MSAYMQEDRLQHVRAMLYQTLLPGATLLVDLCLFGVTVGCSKQKSGLFPLMRVICLEEAITPIQITPDELS